MRLQKITCSLFVVFGAYMLAMPPAYAFDWADLWSSAEQRAASSFEKQQYNDLIEDAPNANWRGLGQYRNGEYAEAAKSFAEQRALAEQAGLAEQTLQAMYNQANAHVFEENYPQALSLFDEILELNPQHDNAQHNRDIVQQLLEQEQQQQEQQNSDEQGDDNQSSEDQQQNEESGEGQESDQQDSEQSENQNQDGQQQDNQDSENQQSNSADSQDSSAEDRSAQSAQDQAAQDAAAAAAMQAEQQRQAMSQPDNDTASTDEPVPVQPLTEREQSNEQWLRQIPDDPAGLLERKLQNRHITDFPKVKDSNEPW